MVDRIAASIPPGGPLVGGAVELRAIAEGQERAYQLQRIYMPVDTVTQFLFCAILIWLSRGSRYRKAMLWMAFYFGAVVFGYDLLYCLDIFAGLSRTPRDWLAPLNFLIWTVAPFEASLALLECALPLWLRILAYALLGLTSTFTRWPGIYLFLTSNVSLLVWAFRRRNRMAAGFQSLMVGYNLVTIAVVPPLSLPLLIPIGPMAVHVVPGYRIVIGLGLILLLIRQSVRDRNERERLAAELEAARTVQQLMVSAAIKGVEAVYHPAHEVGGDFYQVLPLPEGGLLIAVGDVSGKGLKAAMVASMVIGVIRSHVRLAPAPLLSRINRALAGSLDNGFVTCVIARIEADGAGTVANAGHPAIYSEGRELVMYSGLPLGVDGEALYQESPLRASALTLVSDGVLEATNGHGELFGFERTAGISLRPAGEIGDAARAWGQNDDITVVTVRRKS